VSEHKPGDRVWITTDGTHGDIWVLVSQERNRPSWWTCRRERDGILQAHQVNSFRPLPPDQCG
jgi:hypothetical protein